MEQLVASRVIGQDHRHFLAVFLLLGVWLGSHFQASAQQQYNNITGYVCSDSRDMSCNTSALYRAQGNYSTVLQIAELFNTNAAVVATFSKLSSTSQTLNVGQAVIIPITCRCRANSASFANVSYTIVEGDTFYDVNLNRFESLSTPTAIEAVNSNVDPSNLRIGETIILPLRCACPSNAQKSKGVKSLVTYPVTQGDTVDAIASSFGVSPADIINGNTGADGLIDVNTTLLIPVSSSQPNSSYEAPPPPPGASGSSSRCSSLSGLIPSGFSAFWSEHAQWRAVAVLASAYFLILDVKIFIQLP